MNGPFFTKHALEKFEILADHGFSISKEAVIEALASPDETDEGSRKPLIAATKSFEDGRAVRVIYKIVEGVLFVITFYPIKLNPKP